MYTISKYGFLCTSLFILSQGRCCPITALTHNVNMVVELAPSPLYKIVKLFSISFFLPSKSILKYLEIQTYCNKCEIFAFGCCPMKIPLGVEECYVYDIIPNGSLKPLRVKGSKKYTTTFHKSRRCEFWSNEYYMCICKMNRKYTTSILTLGLRSRTYKIHTNVQNHGLWYDWRSMYWVCSACCERERNKGLHMGLRATLNDRNEEWCGFCAVHSCNGGTF